MKGAIWLGLWGLAAALGALATPLAAGPAGRSPQQAPGSILIVLADDLGVDALPIYALDPAVPARLTPNLAALAAAGVLFENAWGCPKCSPARAALNTGRASFRTGIGNVIEAGDWSLAPNELTLSEMLSRHAPTAYTSGFFGKWHLERKASPEPCPPTAIHGYQHFEGSLFQVAPAAGYCSWRKRSCELGFAAQNPLTLKYMPDGVVDSAAAWISSRVGPWLCVLAPQQPYEIGHVPPANLQSVVSGSACSSCSPDQRECYDAAVQALDSELGRLLASLGPAWEERVTVIFTADNGTPSQVNRYWPAGHAKTTLYEGGVRVPLIIAGRGVAPARRGTVASDLAALTDVYRTVAALAGVPTLPPGSATDSFNLVPVLQDPPTSTGRAVLLAETFGRNAAAPPYSYHKVAMRDERFKLIYDWTGRRPLFLFDLQSDPRELQNLLRPTPPAAGTPAALASSALTSRIQGLLGD